MVMLVLDRSGSMDDPFAGSTRWRSLTRALATTLPSVDSSMQIGAMLFPSGSHINGCAVSGAAELMPAFGHVGPLLVAMEQIQPGGATPTAGAIATAGTLLSTVRAASAARALVLATDGAPNCNPTLDVLTCTCAAGMGPGACLEASSCLDDVRTVAEIRGWSNRGLPTYVVGIQDTDNAEFVDVLNAMAVAGGRPLTGQAQSYFAVSSQTQIEQALTTIRNQVGGCVYLTTSLPDLTGSIAVTVNGKPLPFDPTGVDGWRWGDRSNGEIAIQGASCVATAALQNPLVEAEIACGGK
jgi:hypothetical protein